jgi:hypothetical protein
MKTARQVLKELTRYVKPPRGCAVVLTEWKSTAPPEPNWLAAAGIMEGQLLHRYVEKVAELRKSDPKVDWSGELVIGGERRIALWLSELDDN